ncbi:MAG: NTP transferase domain-containing protein [Planctomycetota bacterium]
MTRGVLVAARMDSKRLPGKALLPLGGIPMLAYLIRRLKPSRLAPFMALATTTKGEDDALAALAESEGIKVFRGDEHDVVKRYVEAASHFRLSEVVRVTADCPFVSAETLDYVLAHCDADPGYDLATTKKHFPVGIDYEIYPASGMELLHEGGPLTAEDREHLTLHMDRRRNAFIVKEISPPLMWREPGISFTVDTLEDYERARRLVDALGPEPYSTEALLKAARLS